MAGSDLSESIHRATFGYPLTITDGKLLLEALLNARANEATLRRELAVARADVDGQRQTIERLTAEREQMIEHFAINERGFDETQALASYRTREPLVQTLIAEGLSDAVCECAEAFEFNAAAFAVRDFTVTPDKSSPRSVQAGKRPSRPAARVRDPKSKGGDSARREESSFLPAAEPDATQALDSERAHRAAQTTAAEVFGEHNNLAQLVGADTPVDVVKGKP